MKRQAGLFDADRLRQDQAVELTVQSLLAYGPSHRHWAVAWSGGKDSTALVTLVVYLIESGAVPAPETFTVCYADTRMELTPLWLAAQQIAQALRDRGVEVRLVMAPLDKRFFVYILGRGVPPPNNNTFRWCTRQIKVEPMQQELQKLYGERSEKILMLTGVRQGESAMRDQRTMPEALCDTLAPLLHWRVCHVWDWLKVMAPSRRFGSWPTQIVADAYGGDEAEEINARTGCVGCPLASRDTALDGVLLLPQWAYLAPLKGLRPVYRALRLPANRLRKPGGERRKDGTLSRNQHRMGPLTLEARLWALEEILSIQRQVNVNAAAAGRPAIDMLNAEEEARIRELIAANTWPQKWDGTEPVADEPFAESGLDGLTQPILFGN